VTPAALKRTARRAATTNGHRPGRWYRANGHAYAICACGGYVAVEYGFWSTGRLPIPGARFATSPCTRSQP
jgi:hypothetical protein